MSGWLTRHSVRACSLLLAGQLASQAVLADTPRVWLERMNEALTTRDYDGVFFHVHGGRVETLRIIHRVQGRRVSERLVSLDGSGREFIRQGNELTCYFPDKRTVLVERRPAEGPLLGALPAFNPGASGGESAVYEVRGGERARLSGRNTRMIELSPRDEYRYGYRLWIDEETAMPLKTQLCDRRGAVIEQIVFSNISMPDRIPDSAFQPQVDASKFRWLRDDSRAAPITRTAALWEAMRLPPGFRMTQRAAQAMPGSREPVEHMVFTDGVASVSVFVEPRAAAVPPLQGPARVGSSSAFSTIVDGHQVTAVGEVPPGTVRIIATSVKARASSALSLSPRKR
jgi:sigma-E factor negative regulatory protein RseB